jgi:hypothetical protein
MDVVDPFAPLREWRVSLYRGDPAVIDRFQDGIDAALPPNWVWTLPNLCRGAGGPAGPQGVRRRGRHPGVLVQ